MSPEQVRGETVDARTDLFSFGAVLYEMATGVLAFQGDTTGGIFEAILHGAPADPVRLNQRVSAKLAEITSKALEKDRWLRSQSAAEMRADLARLKRDTESTRHAITMTQPASPEPASGAIPMAQPTPSTPVPAAAGTGTVTPATGATPASGTASVVAPSGKRRWPWLAAAAVVLVATGAGTYFYLHRAPVLTSKDSIVLADFTNTTGQLQRDSRRPVPPPESFWNYSLEPQRALRTVQGNPGLEDVKPAETPVHIHHPLAGVSLFPLAYCAASVHNVSAKFTPNPSGSAPRKPRKCDGSKIGLP